MIVTEPNVYLFIPNLIGYARIVLALVAIYLMPDDHIGAAIAYSLSAGLDALDGMAARYFNQSTRIGALLDQLTDRCALNALVIVTAGLYPDYAFLLILSVMIDISSHWAHFYATLVSGKTNHKKIDSNWLLRLYYESRAVLFIMCTANECFYGLLYLMHFVTDPSVSYLIRIGCQISAPFSILKTFISLIQLWNAFQSVAALDHADRKKRSE